VLGYTLALTYGILAATTLADNLDPIGLAGLFGVSAFLAVFKCTRLAAIAVFGLAWLLFHANVPRLAHSLEGKDLPVSCQIASIPRVSSHITSFDCTAIQAEIPLLVQRLRLNWYDTAIAKTLRPGQRWQFTVRLRRPHGLINPGVVDKTRYLLYQRIGAVGYVRDRQPYHLVDDNLWHLNRWRFYIHEYLQRHWHSLEQRGLMIALIIGERSGIAPETQTRWGL